MILEKYKQRAIWAHNWTSFSPEKRGETLIKEHSEQLEADLLEVSNLGGDPVDYQERYERHFSAWLSAKSRCFSVMITGGSNFPVRKHEKANRSERNHADAFSEFREKYFARLRKNLRREERAAIDPIDEIKGQIEAAEKRQEMMKTVNKIIRSNLSEQGKTDLITSMGIKPASAAELLKPDFCGREGFPSYRLTNNLANIHRMRERLAELEKKATAETKEVERADGIRVVENADADRLQIFFPGKPDSAMIQNLKSRGWRWSPSNGCWQRQLTDNARYSLKQILP